MSEIRGTLEQIRSRLNEFIRNSVADVQAAKDWVILSNLVDEGGQSYEPARNKIVMFLANIQRESAISTYNPNVPVRAGVDKPGKGTPFAVVAPPIYIDLFLLFYANFEGASYAEGLSLISRTISFFQQNLWFTHDNLPGLDRRIEKLTLELTNLEPVDLSYLMNLAGVKYLPSVYYKMRMIPFASDAMLAQVPAVEGVESPGEPADQPTQQEQPGTREEEA